VALEALPTASSDADLDAALTSLGGMRAPIDRFFDEVVVNDDNPSIRGNRLGLLAMVRENMLGVADFSKLEG
jgi:glycyl-tRNA synthetase beta chain